MTSFRQIEASRRMQASVTGPLTETGKQRSRRNAGRHGLRAETVIGSLEDAENYKCFEAAVTANFSPGTAAERELVLRLASLLWRLRRAVSIETGLFQESAKNMVESDQTAQSESKCSAAAVVHMGSSGSRRERTPTSGDVIQRSAKTQVCGHLNTSSRPLLRKSHGAASHFYGSTHL
jgi:hypothetical protein